MLKHLERHKVITSLNHGFRSGYSCEIQLLVTLHDFMKSYDDGLQTDVAIPDFSKAFDTVPVTSCSISLTITMLEDPSTDVSNSEEDEGCH
jgi:hypothetical protein